MVMVLGPPTMITRKPKINFFFAALSHACKTTLTYVGTIGVLGMAYPMISPSISVAKSLSFWIRQHVKGA